MSLKKVSSYLQAGLNENIVKFFWGMIAVIVVSVGQYTYQHLNGNVTDFIAVFLPYFKNATPVLLLYRGWKWAWTTTHSEPLG